MPFEVSDPVGIGPDEPEPVDLGVVGFVVFLADSVDLAIPPEPVELMLPRGSLEVSAEPVAVVLPPETVGGEKVGRLKAALLTVDGTSMTMKDE